MTARRKPARYAGIAIIAEWCGVEPGTVTTWLHRYPDTPPPDAELEPGRNGIPDRGWLHSRRADWEAWKASRPGQGAPGRPRPRKKPAKEKP